jgi:hypothetical protein
MDETGEQHVKQSKPGSKGQRSCFPSYEVNRLIREIRMWSNIHIYSIRER